MAGFRRCQRRHRRGPGERTGEHALTTRSASTYLPYEQIRAYATGHPVRHAEVPVEHALSLPLPTLRWSVAGYATFAGPAVRAPGRPMQLGAPDRWWVVGAQRRELAVYALTSSLPFASSPLTR